MTAFIQALDCTRVYGVIRLINFAHGDLIMAGGSSVRRTSAPD